MMYFTPDNTTEKFLRGHTKINSSDMGDSELFDAIRECSNMCVGALNRELAKVFPHVGMSTPSIIDSQCAVFLNDLRCGYIKNFEIVVNRDFKFHVGLYVNEFADLDFSVDVDETDSTGELELF